MDGARLKLAREAAGMSLRDLESALGKLVSAQAIGKYERGAMAPTQGVLLAMAKVLKVSPHYLLSDRQITLESIDFRKELSADAKAEKATEAALIDYIDRYLDLEEILGLPSVTWCAPSALEGWVPEEVEQAARSLRETWSLGVDPIPNLVEVLEERGIKVFFHALPGKVSGSQATALVRLDNDQRRVAAVVISTQTTGERQRFTLAHELAHFVLPGLDQYAEKESEQYADRFAGAFLVPAEQLFEKAGQHRTAISLAELIELKRYFQVSLLVILARLTQLKVVSKTVAGPFWGLFNARGWKDGSKPEPQPLASLEAQHRRLERLSFRALSEDAISESKACEILRISRKELEDRFDKEYA